ncbi:MAG: hypothetical protein ACFB9N_15740 [Geitlerinemataceae cyanobacterium]
MSDDAEKFIFPRSRYHGDFTPENVIFNANLQEFAQRISYICGLETNGQITSQEAYEAIKELWGTLKKSKKELNIGKPKNPPESN